MLSLKKTMQALLDAGLITGYSTKRVDASWDGDKSLMETHVAIESEKLSGASNETYGKASHIYLYGSTEVLREARDVINRAGGKAKLGCEGRRLDARVSYFKGCRWWE